MVHSGTTKAPMGLSQICEETMVNGVSIRRMRGYYLYFVVWSDKMEEAGFW